jgi:CDP-ribitol ribitolphosphotransferase
MTLSYVQEQEKENIKIIDIFWDRIYLHIILDGDDIYDKEYVIASRKNKYVYPVKLNKENKEIIINITNIHNQEMLVNGKWYIKYLNIHYDDEMIIFDKELEQYNQLLEENSDTLIPKPWIPYLYKDIPLTIECCYKLKDLDKIYRYSGNNYAYIFSFAPLKTREELICSIHSTYMMKNRKQTKRYFRIESGKTKNIIKKWFIYHFEQGFNIIYKIVSTLTPKNGKRILLMSETRAPISGNLKMLDERLKERGLDKEYKISYHFVKTLEHSRSSIFFIWLKLAFLTAKQDYIFVDDYVPFFKYIDVSDKTTLVQVWHAGVGFKSVGYARFGEKGSPYPDASAHRKYDYAIVGGEALRDVYAEVFGIDRENCLPYGLMRIDGYLEPSKIENFKTRFYSEHPEFKDKKIILFAPTFRGTGQRTANYPFRLIDQNKVYDLCKKEGYVFLIKMHPFIRKQIEIEEQYKDCIIDFSSYPDINELFYVTDILITDFSSNIYEFSLQKKPIISYAYDKYEYELLRSVHRTLDKYAPGKVCLTFDEVVETITNKDFEMEKLYKFVEENFDNNEGYACDKVIDHIILNKDA